MIEHPLGKQVRSSRLMVKFTTGMISAQLLLHLLVFPFFTMDVDSSGGNQWISTLKFLVDLFFVVGSVCAFLTRVTDPGYLKKNENVKLLTLLEEFEPTEMCPVCQIITIPRSRHCNICNKCVDRWDHHCPWINSCIGRRNHAYFLIFVLSVWLYLLVLSVLFIVLLVLGSGGKLL